jgi:orotidine-5'-phosphate decarboxylase
MSLSNLDRVAVALDTSDRQQFRHWCELFGRRVGVLKVGLEAFCRFGPDAVGEARGQARRLFLDLKLHDIPNTVQRAAANCARTGASMFNVHAGGGRRMMEAAARGARSADRGQTPLVLAVTVLTSLDRTSLDELGFEMSPQDLAIRWAQLAQDCGLDGVVASAREAPTIRSTCGDDFLIVTPGIRPVWASANDQKRIMTPADAARAGANILVIGRPISQASDPRAAARRVSEELGSV